MTGYSMKSFIPSSWLRRDSSFRLITIFLLFSLHCCLICLAQDDAAVTAPPGGCNTSKCLDTVREAQECSGKSDSECMCATYQFANDLSRCLESTQAGCDAEDASSASDTLRSGCESYISTANAVCLECQSSAADGVGCLDPGDYDCLCGQSSTDYITSFSSCVGSNSKGSITCPKTSADLRAQFMANECGFLIATKKPDGCLPCQASIANELGCDGQGDYSCLCSVDGYIDSVSSCIDTKCLSRDLTEARNSYKTACDLFSASSPNGDATDSARATAGGSDNSADKDGNEDGDGPDTVTVIGVVTGSVAALSLLTVGGYFIFRKRSNREKFKDKFKRDKPINKLPSHNDASAAASAEASSTRQEGVYEMWGSHKYRYPPSAAHQANGPYSQQHGPNSQQIQQPYDKAFELESQGMRPPHGNGWHHASMAQQGFVEMGPSN